MRRLFIVLCLGLLASACTITGETGATVDDTFGYNPGQYSGINQVWIDTNNDGTPNLVGTGGKEQSRIRIKGSIPTADGGSIPFEYEAEDVKAFDGQQFRADLEAIIAKANADGIVQMTPEITGVIDAIVQAAVKVATGGAL